MTDTAERGDRSPELISHVVVRFAGDSGDGMQLTGDRFTSVSAMFGNDLSTFPDFPAEIRAPAGTVNGVSSFQVHISDHDISTPGDSPNVLIAMNPAALKADLHRLEQGGLLIVNTDAFEARDLEKAGYDHNPLDDDSLTSYRVVGIPMTTLTQAATEPLGVKPRDAERSKNFFALGLVSWLYSRPIEGTVQWIESRFKDLVRESNLAAFRAGFHFGETTELFERPFQVRPAQLPARRRHARRLRRRLFRATCEIVRHCRSLSVQDCVSCIAMNSRRRQPSSNRFNLTPTSSIGSSSCPSNTSLSC